MTKHNRTIEAQEVFNEKRKPKTPVKYKISLSEEQKEAKRTILENQVTVLYGSAGTSKTTLASLTALHLLHNREVNRITLIRPTIATENIGFIPGPQPLYSKVLTPTGWSTIGELKIGDSVINKDGDAVLIKDKTPVFEDTVYTVRTTDGKTMECTKDHLFFTQTFNDHKHFRDNPEKYVGSVKTLQEIIDTLYNTGKKKRLNHYLPTNGPIKFSKKKKHTLHPYLLGVLLGDGSFSSSSVSFSSVDEGIINKYIEICEEINIDVVKSKDKDRISYQLSSREENNKPGKPVIITNIETGEITKYSRIGEALKVLNIKRPTLHARCKRGVVSDGLKYSFGKSKQKSTNIIKNELIRLGLFGHRAETKFIPKEYIFNSSIEDRLWLLKGLMDTDGTNDGRSAAFTTISKQLSEDITELVRSLGGRANTYTRDRINRSHNPSKIGGRDIIIRHISYEVCITLDFNPFNLERKAIKFSPKYRQKCVIQSITPSHKTNVQCIILESQDGLYITDDYIVTHNSTDQKMAPWFVPVMENLYDIYDRKLIDKYHEDGQLRFLPLQFTQGVNFKNEVVIFEEAENATEVQIRMALTRLCGESKVIFTGDMSQVQLKSERDSGFKKLISICGLVEGLACFELTENRRAKIVQDFLKHY